MPHFAALVKTFSSAAVGQCLQRVQKLLPGIADQSAGQVCDPHLVERQIHIQQGMQLFQPETAFWAGVENEAGMLKSLKWKWVVGTMMKSNSASRAFVMPTVIN